MFDDLLRANESYTTEFSLVGLAGRAAKGFALVTCMDSRIEPLTMLGLVPGDAKILRNAGGRVTDDTLRSLILATNFLGVDRIAIMQHTDCALAFRSDEEIRADLAGRDTLGPGADPAGQEYLAMPDPDGALRADVDRVRQCPMLPGTVTVEGWRYDVTTGAIARVITSS
jgi:carbonic anhydrase